MNMSGWTKSYILNPQWDCRMRHHRQAGAHCSVVHGVSCLLVVANLAHIVRVGRLGRLGYHAGEVTSLLGVHEEVATLAHQWIHPRQRNVCQPQFDLTTVFALHASASPHWLCQVTLCYHMRHGILDEVRQAVQHARTQEAELVLALTWHHVQRELVATATC